MMLQGSDDAFIDMAAGVDTTIRGQAKDQTSIPPLPAASQIVDTSYNTLVSSRTQVSYDTTLLYMDRVTLDHQVRRLLQLLSLKILSQHASKMPRDKLLKRLEGFASREVLQIVVKYFDNLVAGLAALLEWLRLTHPEYGEPELGVAFDPDTGEPAFLVVVLPGCGEDVWDHVAQDVKTALNAAGLGELARQVAIICGAGAIEKRV